MNYEKHYSLLVKRGQERNIRGLGYEKHHIIPRCLGGSDDTINLTYLTYREHFIAHRLLSRMYPKGTIARSKMIYAMWILSHRLSSNKLITINSRHFAIFREDYSKNNPQKCKIRQERVRQKRLAGEYKYDYERVSNTMRVTLSKLSEEEMKDRMKKSVGNCDQKARAVAIRKGKASLLRAHLPEGEVIEFWSYESEEKCGVAYDKVKYFLKHKNGIANNGVKYEYIKKYSGGNKCKNRPQNKPE